MSGARIETRGGMYEVWNNETLIAACPTESQAELVLEAVSPLIESRAAWTFEKAIGAARLVLDNMRGNYDARSVACVRTKLDEAEMWFARVQR